MVRRRNAERSNALACLEGHLVPLVGFIGWCANGILLSMSDDEDKEAKDEDPGGDADVEDDDEAPERPLPTTSMSSFVLSPPLPSPSRRADVVSRERNRLLIDEAEDRVLSLLT
jgi:hypothetical protein